MFAYIGVLKTCQPVSLSFFFRRRIIRKCGCLGCTISEKRDPDHDPAGRYRNCFDLCLQTETVSEEESDEAELDGEGETSVSKKSDDWKTAYVDYLEHVSDTEGQQGYTLIYLDNDDIPELVEVGKSEASGVRIVNYSNGSVHVNGLNRLYFTYIEGKNLLCNSDGLMDSYYDYIYSIVDGELTLVAQGHYGAKDGTGLRFDKNGMPIYTYDWNGEDVSEDEYNADFAQVYDSSAATEGYDTDKLESIKEVIDDIETK